MKYIRMKYGIEPLYIDEFTEDGKEYYKNSKIADNIEELCDEFVYKHLVFTEYEDVLKIAHDKQFIYGAIWTDNGLIYVAKMNKKGELELL